MFLLSQLALAELGMTLISGIPAGLSDRFYSPDRQERSHKSIALPRGPVKQTPPGSHTAGCSTLARRRSSAIASSEFGLFVPRHCDGKCEKYRQSSFRPCSRRSIACVRERFGLPSETLVTSMTLPLKYFCGFLHSIVSRCPL